MCDVRLLKKIATTKSIVAPKSTGYNTYQYPNANIFTDPILAIMAVAPPDGCKVLVICITTIEMETASADESYISVGMILCTVTPINAQRT